MGGPVGTSPPVRPSPVPMIRASLASIPARTRTLRHTVASLLPQVDRLGVYLNGYSEVPGFLRGRNIDVARSEEHGDRGDAGKFFWADAGDFDYHLTCDDDLVYPRGYAARLVAGVEKYHRRAVVSLHGARLRPEPVDYYGSVAERFHCLSDVEGEHAVHVLGTGAACWHRSLAIDPAIFRAPNMADMWLATWAQREGVPLIVLPHERGWLRYQRVGRKTIWAASRHGGGGPMDTGKLQTRLVTGTDWRLVTPPRCRVVACVVTYARAGSLRRVLADLERERARFDGELEVRVYDDASPEYETVRDLCAERGYAFTSQPEHRGRDEHWRLIADEMADLRDAPADWYVFLPDDVRLCEGFFARAIAAWETLDEPVAMNLTHHEGRSGSCWTRVKPRPAGAGVEVGWVDGMYLARRELLERLAYTVERPPAGFLRRNAGSGVGMMVSRKLVESGARLYRVEESLTTLQAVPSLMHTELRKAEPNTHLYPVEPFATYPVGAARIAADPADHVGKVVAGGAWYEHDVLGAAAALEPDGLYVDVGAHVGNHTAFFACECGARVLSIEPNAASYARLVATVEASGVAERVRCVRAAVHPTWRTGRLVPGPAGNSGMARVADGGDSGTVPVVRLDDLLWDERVGLVKVDVEGNALGVIESGRRVIERDRPLIVAEAGAQKDAITRLLGELGYSPPAGPYGWTAVHVWTHSGRTPRRARERVRRSARGPKAVRLSVAMMAHPARTASVTRMLAALDGDVSVVWDKRNNRWDTGRRAMSAYDPKATHHAVIQDDLYVCRDLCAGLQEALTHIPRDVPLCGYVGRVRPYRQLIDAAVERTAGRKVSWLTMHVLAWGPLVVVPVAAIPEMLAYCDTLKRLENYDLRLSRFWGLERRSLVWYTWPSLVDHADGPSMVPGRAGVDRAKGARPRVAHNFIGEDASALDLDWTGDVIEVSKQGQPLRQLGGPRRRAAHPPIVRR